MFKKVLIVLSILLLSSSLFAKSSSVHLRDRAKRSPFYSVAYYSKFRDHISNPAAVPLVDNATGSFKLDMSIMDSIPFSSFSGPTGYIQDQSSQLGVSFVGRNITLCASLGSAFTNKEIRDGKAYFDVLSNMDIEIVGSFSFPYFSFGASISGGNSLSRYGKHIGGLTDYFANMLFSPFEKMPNSERFSLGAGMLFYIKNYSIGLVFDQIVTLDDTSSLYSSWENLFRNMDIAFAYQGNRFTRKGDLSLVVPRISYSLYDFYKSTYSFSIKGDLKFQFLPDADMSIGVGYRESGHSIFNFDANNGYLDIYTEFALWSIDIIVGASFDTASFSTISPTIAISYEG